MTSFKEIFSQQHSMAPSGPQTSTNDLSALEEAKEAVKGCESAFSLPSIVCKYIYKVLATLFTINFNTMDVKATVAAAIILACRQHKERRFLNELLAHLSASVTGTLMVLWELEHMDFVFGAVHQPSRELSITWEETSEPDAFYLVKEGSPTKLA